MKQQIKYFLYSCVIFILCINTLNSASSTSFASFFALYKHKNHLKKIGTINTVQEINDEIELIKNNILEERVEEVLSNSTKQHNTKQRNKIKNQINKLKNVKKKKLQQETIWFPKRHDTNLPSSMYNDLCNSIEEEGFNPQTIIIDLLPTHIRDNSSFTTLAGANSFFQHIGIFPPLLQKSRDEQLFTYKHELYHIVLNHDFSFYKTNKFTSICEREADIHAASSNVQIARAGMEDRCNFGHSNIFNNQNHCKEMQIMYALMKRKEELKLHETNEQLV